MIVLSVSESPVARLRFPHMQDPAKRKALDASREDARLRELATQAAAQEERERQWRVARGTATAEDLRGPIQVGPAQRDTWMTVLPEAQRANAVPTQVNVVSSPTIPLLISCPECSTWMDLEGMKMGRYVLSQTAPAERVCLCCYCQQMSYLPATCPAGGCS